MPGSDATGARRSAGRAQTHRKPSPRPSPSFVLASRFDSRNESAHRGELLPVTFARRCCRSEEHTSELQSQSNLVCRLLLEKKKTKLKTGSFYGLSIEQMQTGSTTSL